MKISYNTLKRHIKYLKSPEEVAKDLVMHTAEVEEIEYEWENLKSVFIWEVLETKKHPDSEKLNLCKVSVCNEEVDIVCGAPNVKAGLKVPVAVVWAKLAPDFVIQKTKIRWCESHGMICSEDELWLVKERQDWIMELPIDSPINACMRDYLWTTDAILEIDNKAINHRPDLFSHVWIIREIHAINGEKFDFEYENRDFTSLSDLWIKNKITDVIKRYIWLKISGVENIESPSYVKEVLKASWAEPKWLLIDLSNYSLYMYGQPIHIFDADIIEWNITTRYAKSGERLLALDDKEYELSEQDIVIADDKKVLALAGIIGWKSSSVSDTTKNITIEWANFDQATLRMTWKRLWLRTDALNVFEKDLLPETALYWVSLVVSELEKSFKDMKLVSYSDSYPEKQKSVKINLDLNFINRLIWREYTQKEVQNILTNLGIQINWDELLIPAWRKDLTTKSDIAEEVARIHWYNNVKSEIPGLQLWAILQDNTYKIKTSARNFFVNKGFFDMYTYSFVNESLMNKLNSSTDNLVPLKNYLSEDATHMKDSLIPNLMLSLEKNIRDSKDLSLFEIEKVFKLSWDGLEENYDISAVVTNQKDILYYDMQETVSLLFRDLWLDKFSFEKTDKTPSYAHSWRTAKILARWQDVGIVWEIHPKVAKNFSINSRVWFFEINLEKIKDMVNSIIKAKELSNFQASNFDISFVVDKSTAWKDIALAIEKTDTSIIEKVELFDIYEDEKRLAWQRSLSFKVFLQSMDSEITDEQKNKLIKQIVEKVEKKWGTLR